jgi:hypothetical protein
MDSEDSHPISTGIARYIAKMQRYKDIEIYNIVYETYSGRLSSVQ